MSEAHPEWVPLLHDHSLDADVLAWLTGQIGQQRHPMVLDVGCGAGLPLERLVIDAGAEVVGVDSSPVAVDLARQNVPEAIHVERDLFDLDGLHPEGVRFDAVVSAFALAGLSRSDVERVLAVTVHVLKPGAVLLLAMPDGRHRPAAVAVSGRIRSGDRLPPSVAGAGVDRRRSSGAAHRREAGTGWARRPVCALRRGISAAPGLMSASGLAGLSAAV